MPDQRNAQVIENGVATAVTCSIDRRGLAFRKDGDRDPTVWPFGPLSSDPALTAGLREADLTYSYAPGAVLRVNDASLLEALADAAPHLTSAHQLNRRVIHPALWIAFAALMAGLIWWMTTLTPARWIASQIPNDTRVALGRTIASSMVQRHGRCSGAAGRLALENLYGRLIAHDTASQADAITGVHVLDWSLVNAFATPGGYVFLTRGLIEMANSPDEVAGVLAHEIGHVKALHPEAGVVRSVGIWTGMSLIFGGGVLTDLSGALLRRSYSREDEREADEIGAHLLREAGISPSGLADFFARQAEKERNRGSGLMAVWSTHPASSARLAAIRDLPHWEASAALSPSGWMSLRTICGSTAKGLGTTQ